MRTKIAVEEFPNETISYRESRQYTFVPDESSESELVNITTMNIVYLVNKILII